MNIFTKHALGVGSVLSALLITNAFHNGVSVAEEAAKLLHNDLPCTQTASIVGVFGDAHDFAVKGCTKETNQIGKLCTTVTYQAANWSGPAKAHGCINTL